LPVPTIKPYKQMYSHVVVRPEFHSRIRTLASRCNKPMLDLMHELFEPVLTKAERDLDAAERRDQAD
jgi:hypothetical protein